MVFFCLTGWPVWAQSLKNASFEDPDDPKKPHSDHAKDWGRWGTWLNREDNWVYPHNGKCLMAYHHWEVTDNEPSGFYQDVSGAKEGDVYTFSISVWKDPATNADSIELRIERAGGGGVVAANRTYLGTLEDGKWRQLSVTGTNASEGLRVVVAVTPAQDKARVGAIKFDDAKLQKAK